MSKTLALVLGLALVWLTAWVIAGYYMRQAGIEKLIQSDHLSYGSCKVVKNLKRPFFVGSM